MTQVRWRVATFRQTLMNDKPLTVTDLRRENLSLDEEDVQRANIVPSLMQRCDDP